MCEVGRVIALTRAIVIITKQGNRVWVANIRPRHGPVRDIVGVGVSQADYSCPGPAPSGAGIFIENSIFDGVVGTDAIDRITRGRIQICVEKDPKKRRSKRRR